MDHALLDEDDFGDNLIGSSGLEDGDYENVPPISTNLPSSTPETNNDTSGHKYITVISDNNIKVNETSTTVEGKSVSNSKQYATSQGPIPSKPIVNHMLQPKSDTNATSQTSAILRRSSAYAYSSMAPQMKESTAAIQTHFDPISRTMSSPPRSSSSSGYGTGSSRKSYTQQYNNSIAGSHGTNFPHQATNSDVVKRENTLTGNRWYEDSASTQKSDHQFINAYHHPINNGPSHHGLEIAHSSSSPMSSISDGSSSISPANIPQPSNKIESTIISPPPIGITSAATRIGSGKNSAFQRVVSTNRGNSDENQISQSLRQSALGDQHIASSGSSATNSTTSSPKITQMIYQQPPKPSRLVNSNNNNLIDNKRSPSNMQHIKVIYDSSGNTTDRVIYHAQPQQSNPVSDAENTSNPSRRHLLEEKRSIDAKVNHVHILF